MSAAVTIALSSAALAQSSAAQQAATEAKTASCQLLVQTYQNNGNIDAAKAFADCVQFLHPDDMSSGSRLALKLFVLLAMVSFVVGTWVGANSLADSWSGRDWISGLLCGAAAALAIPLLVGLLVAGIGVLFS